MSSQQSCPDHAAWKEWIEIDREDLPDPSVLVSHLDQCRDCQEAVSNLFDEDPFASKSRSALKLTGLTSVDWRQESAGPAGGKVENDSDSAIVAVVQALLGPTEDLGSLGRLGRFEVLGIVGSGGMGIVLKARSVDMDRVVAIKIPQPQYWQSAETLMTLEREARSAAAVVHPNVIAIYHVDRYRDVPYLVMPYLPGESLEQRVRSSGPLSIEETLRIARQVSSALAAAHACGVVHRDVKPANILLGSGTERVVLSDFGLAKIQSDATCTATGTFAGTPIYLSPEQASGHGAGPAGDIYSLGTVIWTMVCGEPPLVGMHTHAIVRKIAEGQMPTPTDRTQSVPDWMFRLIECLHAAEPARRPSAETLVEWIEMCQKHLLDPDACSLPDSLAGQQQPQSPSRRFVSTIGATSVVFAGVLLVGWQVYQSSIGPSEIIPEQTTIQTGEGAEHATQSAAGEDELKGSPEVASEVEIDSDDLYLNSVQAELRVIKETTEPTWESKLKAILGDDQ